MANTEKKVPFAITHRSFGRDDCVDTETGKVVNTDRIYELEDVITRSIQKACEWRAENFGEHAWRESTPSELLFVLNAFERHAAYLAARTFIEEYEGRMPHGEGQTYDPDALREIKSGPPLTEQVRDIIATHAAELHLTSEDIDALQREYKCLKVSTRQFEDICATIYEKVTGEIWTSSFQGRGRSSRLAGWTLAGILRGKEDPYKYAMDNNG